ncbi:ribonuclease T2 family protein [Mesorhizobium xinjiangense]|uniref:ribonuclease T2 family protein n=1 Tax=Mesorhizobium xinjiangense TaxID=2678685 RepID=UPI0012ED53BA|nr:ribonuclease T2 [Mesorhizobium xinjiangense]
MRASVRLAVLVGMLLSATLAAGCEEAGDTFVAGDTGRSLPIGEGFDFYVLSLSWSPSYCAAEGADANRQQCGSGRPYAFVVHGLWPQFERGYPEYCALADRDVPSAEIKGLLPIMPSAGLIRHQWVKHGSCAGLSREEYFAVLRAAHDAVVIPQDFRHAADYRTIEPKRVEQAFLEANPDLDADGIAVTCDRRYLREVRICLTRDLQFRACEEVDRRGCKRREAVMPPQRGG